MTFLSKFAIHFELKKERRNIQFLMLGIKPEPPEKQRSIPQEDQPVLTILELHNFLPFALLLHLPQRD